jgi:VWFA-related protein
LERRIYVGVPMNGYRLSLVRFSLCLSVCLLCPSTRVLSAAQAKNQPTQSAQTTPTSPPGAASTLQIRTDLVLVDVVVTNSGVAVNGLPKGKFHIFEDGSPQQLATFEEHGPGDSPVISTLPSLGPNIYSDFPDFAITSAANVLLLDALNTPLSDQMYVRQQMTQYLQTIPPGTRIAVFTLASRLRMVEGFTTDSTVIAKALAGESGSQQSVMLDGAANGQYDSAIDAISGPGPVQRASSSLQQFAADLASFQTDMRVQMTLDAMKGLARYLKTIPGRKNLIWFSGSFPLAIDPDAAQSRSFTAMRNYADDLSETAALLTTARVAVYPVDARGLMSLPSTSAVSRFTPVSSGPPMPGKGSQSTPSAHTPINARGGTGASPAAAADEKFLRQTALEHATMRQIAEDTGGKAFLDTNAVKQAVGQAIADGERYYTIGYIPEITQRDGVFRRIKVNVEGGYQLSYRRGYYAYDSLKIEANSSASSNLMRMAIQHGAPPLSEIPFKVRVIAASDPAAKNAAISPEPAGVESKNLILKGTKTRYLIDYAVDAHKIAYTTTPDGVRNAHIEFAVAAYDENGKLLNHADRGTEMKLNPALYEQVARLGLPMHQEIDLPPGHIFLRIVVHDMDGGLMGTSEISLTTATER